MILTCPNCGTQYAVKDGAIPPQGRQVRCASCKHSWHQGPDPADAVLDVEEAPLGETPAAPETIAPAAVTPEFAPGDTASAEVEPDYAAFESVPDAPDIVDEDETIVEATMIEPRSGPEAEERAFEEAAIAEVADTPMPVAGNASSEPAAQDWREPPEPEPQSDDYIPFDDGEASEEPRRRLLPLLLILLLIAALSAAFWFFAPAPWKAQLGLVDSTSQLALVTTHMDRQKLESGNELLTISGRVINPTGQEQPVPPLSAQLKSSAGKVVYSWTIAPPARTLAPGASASFNSAEVNVPPGGDELTITLGGARS